MKETIRTNPEAVIQGKSYRISVLTESLLRLEYSEDGVFEDRATQAVVNRNFPVPCFRFHEDNDSLTITTSRLVLKYDKKPFSRNGLSIRVLGGYSNYRDTWYYGMDFTDLGGTARTLDKADGPVPLEHGLMSKNGFSVYDDSRSLVQTSDGWVQPRERKAEDLYFFGYGHDYKQCLKDFYHLCGSVPLLPRYALGNWWSRYYEYTDEEYRQLMLRFEQEHIPFSVAVLDINWHLVDVDPKYGSGWTGYTWNRELFPNPEDFLKWLHDKGYQVTLNVHPAAGVRAFEEAYLPMAKELGTDWQQEETIEFDITDRKFLEAYFKYLHHPGEEMGVDFWWIDWQQQSHSKVEGLDPLWMLNHYHFLDSQRNGKRGLTFSRYAGIGSHRYPIGFSGDTYITWESLDFQPYFTATASNVGYGWWSHDIGGHMHGRRDDELAARWVQFGVFSPINRLHSSDNLFSGKEPWNFQPQTADIMIRFLQLRHQLIPYLYTMNRLASEEGRPLILPLYYEYPEAPEAYEQKNQYFFGTELIAAPVTKPMDKEALLAETSVWLPEGLWYDFFTGMAYEGGIRRKMYRNLETIPVLAKAGAIIPMLSARTVQSGNFTGNPETLFVKVFAGASGSFTLWEDEGSRVCESEESWCQTQIELVWEDTVSEDEKEARVIIAPAKGNTGVIPEKRRWCVELNGVEAKNISVTVDGKNTDAVETFVCEEDGQGCRVQVTLAPIPVSAQITLKMSGLYTGKDVRLKRAEELLMKAQIEYDWKQKVYEQLIQGRDPAQTMNALYEMNLNPAIYGAFAEMLGAGRD